MDKELLQARTLLRTLEEQIRPEHSALLIVDVQNDFVHPDGLYGRMCAEGKSTPFFPGSGHLWETYALIPRALANLDKLLDVARQAGVLVVFVRAIYNSEYLSPPFQVMMEEWALHGKLCQADTFGADFYEEIRPNNRPREIVVTKHRQSGFQGTDLDLVLRSNGIKTVLVTGTATNGCVESTARDAFFNDYYTIMIEDCCADRDQERHDASMRAMGMGFGYVTALEAVKGLWLADR